VFQKQEPRIKLWIGKGHVYFAQLLPSKRACKLSMCFSVYCCIKRNRFKLYLKICHTLSFYNLGDFNCCTVKPVLVNYNCCFSLLCKLWHIGWIYHRVGVLTVFPLCSISSFISIQYLCTAVFELLAEKSKFCFYLSPCSSPQRHHFLLSQWIK
jgi:hypothetical protein